MKRAAAARSTALVVGEWTDAWACVHHCDMAKTTIVQVTDDLDGSKGAEEVSFSFQGTDYTIDLAKKNLSSLEKALKPYIEAATKVPKGPSRRRRSSKSAGAAPNLGAVREWARSAGIEVSSRGRIPQAVLDQYEAARKS